MRTLKWLKWSVVATLVIVVGGFLHWSLPSRDIVRILGTEVQRRGDPDDQMRDVRYIKAVTPGGNPRVYRNEDTGWGWPPFFKFNSANLAAVADNAVSTEEDPRWMIVRHYGWRIPMLSKFPNAVSVRAASGPDQMLIPWFNIVVVGALLAALAFVWLRLRRWFGG